jgi:hypothetical protein
MIVRPTKFDKKFIMSAVKKQAVFCMFFLSISFVSVGQQTLFFSWDEFPGRWCVGLTLGPDFYYGDLNKTKAGISRNVSIAGGAFVSWQMNNIIGLRGEWLIGGLTGTLVRDPEPYNNFHGVFSDFTVNATFDFTNIILKYNPFRKAHVYGLGGVGIMTWSSASNVGGQNVSGLNAAAVLPFGFGAFYTFGNRLNIGLEWTTRVVMSDKLDQWTASAKFDYNSYLSFWISLNFNQLKDMFQKQEK